MTTEEKDKVVKEEVIAKAEVSSSNDNDDFVVQAVAERLQFFFSDANVRSDRYMRDRLLKPQQQQQQQEGNDGSSSSTKLGYVPIDVLLRFNSIKQHTADPKVVAAAAKTLDDSLVLADDELSIARKRPFSMKMMNDNIPLSLYVSNIPVVSVKTEEKDDDDDKMVKKEEEEDDDKKSKQQQQQPTTRYAVKMQDIRSLFEPYGNVTLVKLRFKRPDSNDQGTKRNVPAGAAFVEFATVEDLQKAADHVLTTKDGQTVDAKRKLKLGGNTLDVISMKEWVDSKKMKKKNDDHSSLSSSPTKKRDRDDDDGEPVKVIEEFKIDWKKGCVIKLKGLAAGCDREGILAAVAKGKGKTDEEIKGMGVYADFSRGQTEGAIRFSEPDESIAELATKLANGDIEIAGAKVESATLLEGDDETKYWADFIEFKNKQLKHRAERKRSRH